MSTRPWSVFVVLAAFILVVGAACSAASGGASPTATPEATHPPQLLPTTEPKPTVEMPALPTQGSAPSGAAPFELDSTVYKHPSGTFSFNPPAGWTPDEGRSGVVFTSPDEAGKLDFSVTNTGYQLDAASLEEYVKATEANYFGSFSNYNQDQYQFDKDKGTAQVSKSLTSDKGDRKVLTYYLQQGQGVYEFDFWANADVAADYSDAYAKLLDTIKVNGDAVSSLPVYSFINTFTDKNNLFQFEVPLSWTYAYDEGKNYYSDTFTSPDKNAFVENISYDDGTTFTKSDAGATALNLLNKYYTNGAGDIKVTGDVVQSDGSERLDWTSKQGGYSGQSFFETRGTTFLMLSLVSDDKYSDVYSSVFDNTVSTYKIP